MGANMSVPPPSAITGVRVEMPIDLPSELVEQGSVSARQSELETDLSIYITGEHQGSLETCGCPIRPRGSVARSVSYIKEARTAHPDSRQLVLNGGYWLSDAISAESSIRRDAVVQNEWVIRGLEAMGTHAANVSWADLPGLEGRDVPAWAVSANVITTSPQQSPISASTVVDLGGVKIGITGITEPSAGFIMTPNFEIVDPIEPAVEVLNSLAGEVDLLVLLSYRAHEAAAAIAERVPELDLIVDTGVHRDFYPPFLHSSAIWTRSHFQTQRLGELLIDVQDNEMTLLMSRMIDMDPEISDDPEAHELMIEARRSIERIQMELFGL
jgi:2',3'-cyclic-nucleotide 2'-phosphodiesterase (5'-nucleotidase family)